MNKNIEAAATLAKLVRPGLPICLYGDVGAGKTTLVKQIVAKLRNESDCFVDVTSPTFNIVNIYEFASYKIWHFDLYRLKYEYELEEIGVFHAIHNEITMIEWPELCEKYLYDHIRVNIDNDRNININIYNKT